MDALEKRRKFRWGVSFLLILTSSGIFDYLHLVKSEGYLELSQKIRLSQYAGWAFIGVMTLAVLTLWVGKPSFIDTLLDRLDKLSQSFAKLRWPALLLGVLLYAVYPVLIFSEASIYFAQTFTRLAIFAWVVLFQSVLFAIWRQKQSQFIAIFSLVSLAMVYHLVTYFPHVSSYPFGLWWSEVSRFYLASTFFDERIYGVDTPWVFRDTTRYLLQAIPHLFSSLPLWAHRLWQVILRFGSSYIAGWIFARRLNLPRRTLSTIIFIIWSGLYLFQGPVFYNLLVVVMLSLWLIDPNRYARTLIAVAGITVWAGFSRVNWVPMPALIGVIFYLLQKPYTGKGLKYLVNYFWQPVSWVVVGLGVGLLTQNWYASNSGNIEGVATTSFTSDLIWRRLFPNPSYPLGIILAILLVSLPLVVYLILAVIKSRNAGWHWLRPLGIAAIIAVLFAGGLLVSVKIGGGTNLHNMDVYLVAVWITAVSLYYGKAVTQNGENFEFKPPIWLMVPLIAAPVVFAALFGGRSIQPVSSQVAQQDLETLRGYVEEAVSQGQEVLFISQRHLITFGYIENVPLVHEYEKMELMDNVMAGTPAYLEAFAADLSDQRFGLIIQDTMPSVWKNPLKDSLAQENNVYLKRAVPLISCAYEEEIKLVNKSVQLMVPKADSTCGQIQE